MHSLKQLYFFVKSVYSLAIYGQSLNENLHSCSGDNELIQNL